MHSVDLKKSSTSVRTIRFDDGRLKIEDIVDIAAKGDGALKAPIRKLTRN
jgi:hypothetical protein